MTIIAIKDIEESTFSLLETKLPLLPAGLGNFEIKNPHMLMLWKEKFIELYGEEGTLFLEWQPTDQVVGNERYVDAVSTTHKIIVDLRYM